MTGSGPSTPRLARLHDVMARHVEHGAAAGLGTGWTCDPAEEMVVMLLTQTAWTSPQPPNELLDLRTSASQAIDD